MLFKAILAFVLLPGVFGVLIPLLLSRCEYLSFPGQTLGFILTFFGLTVLLICTKDFYVSGKGSLAPWAPPKIFVSTGLYQYTRNPMYISVLLLTVGAGLGFGSILILLYSLLLFIGFHIRIVKFEEPRLEQRFGRVYEEYRQATNRWIPRFR